MEGYRLLIRVLIVLLGTVAVVAPELSADVAPDERTADMPDSWIVLFNLNDPDSVTWSQWYQQQREIPPENLLGLDAPGCEHLASRSSAETLILNPVKTFFQNNPAIEARTMGIILGYGLPSNFGDPPAIPGVGGFSVANALQDLSNSTTHEVNWECPHMVAPYGALPVGGRITKADMRPSRYMVVQIDGASLEDAKLLTTRAKKLENALCRSNPDAHIWYDYTDGALPGNTWYWLQRTVDNDDFSDLPWVEFDADTEQTPYDSLRFGTHDLTNWDDERLRGEPAGGRILAFNFNSWGATTVRSCSDQGARYVCNAIAAGYAAAIGATGEPECCLCPFPDTLIGSLREGWTIGEAFYLSNPFDDWMWTILADPFLHLPCWLDFDLSGLRGDVNADGMVNLRDLAGFRACIKGPNIQLNEVCEAFDFDGDLDCDLLDFAGFQAGYTGGAVKPRSGDANDDGVIDLDDFEEMLECDLSPGPKKLGQECELFDLDFDLDVDFADYAGFQLRFTTEQSVVIPGDYDRDLDVDLLDIAFFQDCFSGPVGHPGFYQPSVDCLRAFDLEGVGSGIGDGDVDLNDYFEFKENVTGPEPIESKFVSTFIY